VRHARRILQERAAAGTDMSQVHRELHRLFAEQGDVPRKLRALWALYVTGGTDEAFLTAQLDHESEYVRGWAVQLLCEDRTPPDRALARFRDMAKNGDSSLVRLRLASALQRLDADERWLIAEALIGRADDHGDPNLPLMNWYAVEPLVHEDLVRFVDLAAAARIPLVRRHIARRVASLPDAGRGIERLVQLVGERSDPEFQSDLLAGLLQGFEGRRSADMPRAWPAVYTRLRDSSQEAVGEQALQLALVFDDPVALNSLLGQAGAAMQSSAVRNRAIQALVAKRAEAIAPLLLQLVRDPSVRNAAIRGLAEFRQRGTVEALLENYASFDATARQDALQTLASRSDWALALIEAVESGRIPRSDVTAYTARQLQSLGDERVAARVAGVWGEVRETPAEKSKLIARYKARLNRDSLRSADRSAGRATFRKLCANCHRLFDEGAEVGPELTGAQRISVEYLLENLIDPSAAISRDYQMQVIETAGGRIITGLAVAENENAVTIQTVNEKVVVPLAEIEARVTSRVSMMPDGILQDLSFEQVRDLIAYLGGPGQVPLAEAATSDRAD
jgi:putative heme-binding domain-containing protein